MKVIGQSIYLCAIGLVAMLLTTANASAASVAKFYEGKTISLYIGFGPGGGNDRWARTLARHLPKYLPGHPTMVAKNMPGAGSLKLANYLYNAAPQDGTAIGLISRGIPLEPLLGGKGTQFDALKFNWIGSPAKDTTVCAAWRGTSVKSMQDLFHKELIVGATGSGADTNVYPQFLSNLLGMKFKVIRGYKGSKAIFLAMERREVDGICIAFSSLARRAPYKDGKIRVLFQAGLAPDPTLKDIPFITDLAKNLADKRALELFFSRVVIGRPFLAPPKVPAERIQALQDAFDKTMVDPKFLAAAKKVKLRVNAVSGSRLAEVIRKVYGTPSEVVKRTAVALGR